MAKTREHAEGIDIGKIKRATKTSFPKILKREVSTHIIHTLRTGSGYFRRKISTVIKKCGPFSAINHPCKVRNMSIL